MASDTKFRITMDVPYTFCTAPGYERQVHCHNFSPQKDSHRGTWQDPLTGLILLEPSFLTPGFSNTFRGLDNWQKANTALSGLPLWHETDRAADSGGATVLPSASMMTWSQAESTETLNGSLAFPTDRVVNAVQIATAAFLAAQDRIEIALESIFAMAPDQGFVLHFNAITDQMHRKKNWFAVVWDKYIVHFSMDGSARIMEYAVRGVYTDAPKLLQEFQIASPAELVGRDGYIAFLPIPGLGLRLIHSFTPQALFNNTSSARSAASRGVLIPLPTRQVGGFATVFSESKIWLAVNPWHPMGIGFQEIVYDTDTAASFVDAIFDMGYKPDLLPDDVSAFVPAADLRGALLTATLRNPDDSDTWSPSAALNAGDRQGRVKVALQTTDTKYTPFLLGYGVKWLPVRHTRDTTPVEPDSVYHLEWTEDDLGHFEGACTTLMHGEAQRKLVERGDTTFIVEESADGGDTWVTVNGGFAQIDTQVKALFFGKGALCYEANWKLVGMEGVFDEMTQVNENAFDGLTPGEAINLVLNACGFPFIDPLPEGINDPGLKLPQTPKGQEWRFGTREGDKGDHIIKQMLLLAKRQYQEWRLRYDWDGQTWVMEERPRDITPEGTWTLTPFEDEVSIADKIAPIQSGGVEIFTFSVTSPECNNLQPFGLTTTGHDGERVPGTVLVNKKSLDDPTSVDYLGRFKNARPLIAPVEDLGVINWMGRRVYDAAAHRRLKPVIPSRVYVRGLIPGTHVRVRGVVEDSLGNPVRRDLFTETVIGSDGTEQEVHLWIKRRSVILDYNKSAGEVAPTISYALDTIWDSEL